MMPASERPAGMSDVEWQLRNWYNFVWLSGDGLVEQACHSIDKIAWAMNGALPIKAVGNGGRQIPNHQGNIFDHIDVVYEYANGVRAGANSRPLKGVTKRSPARHPACANRAIARSASHMPGIR